MSQSNRYTKILVFTLALLFLVGLGLTVFLLNRNETLDNRGKANTSNLVCQPDPCGSCGYFTQNDLATLNDSEIVCPDGVKTNIACTEVNNTCIPAVLTPTPAKSPPVEVSVAPILTVQPANTTPTPTPFPTLAATGISVSKIPNTTATPTPFPTLAATGITVSKIPNNTPTPTPTPFPTLVATGISVSKIPNTTPTINIDPSPTTSITNAPTVTVDPNCPRKPDGDADCNGRISMVDYNIFLDNFRRYMSGERGAFAADFDSNSQVSLVDFNTWKNSYINELSTSLALPKDLIIHYIDHNINTKIQA